MIKFIDNYPLKNVTTLSIGGPAKKFVKVKTEEELIEAIKHAQDQKMPYLIIGGGSNLLVADEGVDKLVIKNEITGIEKARGDGEKGVQTRSRSDPAKPASEDARRDIEPAGPRAIVVKSGTPLQKLVDYTISHGLSGLQKLSGIPGTVGGAVYGNAGAYGQTISDHIVNVVVINSSVIPAKAGIHTNNYLYRSRIKCGMTKKGCRFGYRDSIFKKTYDIILEVHFQLEPRDTKQLEQEAKDILAKRLVKYPPGIKCPGSFFKNIIASTLPKDVLDKIPPGKIVYGKLPAGALLEEVGAKGQKVGGIAIANYHANLFINQDKGTAQAFYNLAKKYAEKVKEKFGIILEPEVQLINLPPI